MFEKHLWKSDILSRCLVFDILKCRWQENMQEKHWRFPDIRGLFRMRPLENWWLNVQEIPVSGNSPHVPQPFPFSFPVFHIVFPLFHRAFPMFPLVFLFVSYFRSYDSAIEFTADYSKDRVNLHHTFSWKLNPIQDRWQKGPTICFSPVTSTNVGISS